MSGRLEAFLRSFARNLRTLPRRRKACRLFEAFSLDDKLSVCYLGPEFPRAPGSGRDVVTGGAVKLLYLQQEFPHQESCTSILYIVSSVPHPAWLDLAHIAKKKGIKVVLNQNGVYYPAWSGKNWARYNEPLAALHAQADAVIYQSDFSKGAAQKFLGVTSVPQRVILNPVALDSFTPRPAGTESTRLKILTMSASTWRFYRLQTALEAFALVLAQGFDVELVVAGFGTSDADAVRLSEQLIKQLKIPASRVRLLPAYSRAAAPELFRSCDLFLHTVYNDNSPNVIGEALASGLPVVYSESGGIPEIIGEHAGVGIFSEASWERIMVPTAESFAAGCVRILSDRSRYAAEARKRAEQHLGAERFCRAHREIFTEVMR